MRQSSEFQIVGQKLLNWAWSDSQNNIYIFKQNQSPQGKEDLVYRSSNIVIEDVLEGVKLTSIPDPETGNLYTQVDSIVLISKTAEDVSFLKRFYGGKMKYLSCLADSFLVRIQQF